MRTSSARSWRSWKNTPRRIDCSHAAKSGVWRPSNWNRSAVRLSPTTGPSWVRRKNNIGFATTMLDNERFQAAYARFDAANGEDPRHMVFQGCEYPFELLYAQRMTHWLE